MGPLSPQEGQTLLGALRRMARMREACDRVEACICGEDGEGDGDGEEEDQDNGAPKERRGDDDDLAG